MKKHAVILAFCAACLFTQPARAQSNDYIKRIFALKYADPRQVSQVISIFAKSGMPNYELRSLAVEATASSMQAIEDAIKKLDVAPDQRNVELTVYYLTAGNREATAGNPVPAELSSVTAQLQKAFAYKQYRLLESIVIRTRSMQPSEASSALAGRPPAIAQLKIRAGAIGADGVIHIDQLNAGIRFPIVSNDGKGSVSYNEVGVNTAVDVREGQKVVVGKSGMQGPDEALFLVLTAKVLQ